MTGDLQRIAEGREAEVFIRGDGLVVKLMRDATDASRVDREIAALRAVADTGLPAPQVHNLVQIDGRPGLVLDRLQGEDLLTYLGRNPLRVDRVALAMARTHAAMHELAAPAQLPDLKDELRLRIENAGPLPDELREPVLAVLASLPTGDRLCHGDFHAGNMLGDPGAPAVIDWADASRGDPTSDMIRTAVLLRVGKPPPGASAVIRGLAPVGGSLLSARYVAHYRRIRDIDDSRFAQWRLVRAAARVGEPIPKEHPALIRIIRRDLRSVPT